MDSAEQSGPEAARAAAEGARDAELCAAKAENAALTAEVARMRALVNVAGDALELSNREGAISYANSSVERILGLAASAREGESTFDRLHPEDLDEARARHAECLARPGRPVAAEHRLRREDGTYRYVRGCHVSHLEEPAIAAVVTSYHDVTDRRVLEEHVMQTQKMEAVGRLAGGIAHDFNNMLTVISGVARMIQSQLSPGDAILADLDEITNAADRAAILTRQLLAFSRKQMLKPKVLDLSAHVLEIEKMLRRVIGEDVTLETHLSANLWPVKVDPGQLEQVMLNLVVNARDAMPGGGKLVIKTANTVLDREHLAEHVDVASGAYAMLSVADTGHGMDKRVMARMFEPFFTTKGPGQGTGLGLAMVFGIVKQSGGHIEATSEPGRGTTFSVYLPRSEDQPSSRDERPQRIRGVAGRETILLVEDDALVRQFARRALERHGYRVLEASNGGEAILIVEEDPGVIDLLITDVVMPRVGGRQVADRITRIRPGVRVLFMSGYAHGEADARGAVGDAEFLPKPVTPDALLRKVREILDRPPRAP